MFTHPLPFSDYFSFFHCKIFCAHAHPARARAAYARIWMAPHACVLASPGCYSCALFSCGKEGREEGCAGQQMPSSGRVLGDMGFLLVLFRDLGSGSWSGAQEPRRTRNCILASCCIVTYVNPVANCWEIMLGNECVFTWLSVAFKIFFSWSQISLNFFVAVFLYQLDRSSCA